MELCWNARPTANCSTTRAHNKLRRQKIRSSHSTLTAANADDCFRYLHRHKVLICVEHATGVQNLNSHLRDYHVVLAKERKEIVVKYSWATTEKVD